MFFKMQWVTAVREGKADLYNYQAVLNLAGGPLSLRAFPECVQRSDLLNA